MANVLVVIEHVDGVASTAALRALNQGRKIATIHGATLYAVVPCSCTPSYGDDDIVATLSRYGADKVVLVTNEQLTGPLFYETHDAALLAVCDQLPPQLVLMPASGGGRDVGPRLALDLDGYYLANATPQAHAAPTETRILHPVLGRSLVATPQLAALQRPLVLGLRATAQQPEPMGIDEAEVVVIQAPTKGHPRLGAIDTTALPCPSPIVMLMGERLSPAAKPHLDKLATTLSARLFEADELASAGPALAAAEGVLAFCIDDEIDPWELPAQATLISVDNGSSKLRAGAEYVLDSECGPEVIEDILSAITAMG